MLKQEILQQKYNVCEELLPFIFLWTYHLLGLDDVFFFFCRNRRWRAPPQLISPWHLQFHNLLLYSSLSHFFCKHNVVFCFPLCSFPDNSLCWLFFFFFTITIHFTYIFIYLCIRRLRSCSWMVISDKIALLCICRFSSSSSFYFSLVWVLLPSHLILRDPYAVFHCWLSTFLPWITQYSQ